MTPRRIAATAPHSSGAAAEDDRRLAAALTGTLHGLDGLRGLAIGGVLCAHFLNAWPGGAPLDRAVIGALGLGWAGVDLFFVLSGLLITGILVDTLGARGWWTSFMARRALRIFPLYYLALAAFGWLGPAAGLIDPWTFGRWGWWYWSYLGNWAFAARQVIPPLSHFWSLAVEEQFYLAWPAVVWLARGRRLGWVALVLVLLGPALRAAIVLGSSWPAGTAYRITPGRIDELAMGALLAVLLRGPGGRAWLRRWWGPAAAAGALAFVALGLACDAFDMHQPALEIWSHTLLGLAFGGLVAGAVCTEGTGAPLQRWLAARPLRALGRYAYGIYVIHYFVHLAALRWLRATEGGAALLARRDGYLAYAAAGAGVTVLLAMASFALVERPFLALKRHFVPRLAEVR
jgi:peptidoglycan/LPS O-acetylase OafA/YrhL